MFEMIDSPAAPAAYRTKDSATAPHAGAPRLGDTLADLLSASLNEIDYGLLLVAEDGQALHVNHAARAELDDAHPLQMLGRTLRARASRDVAPLVEALGAACGRGLRRMLALGEGAHRVSVAVVPLAPQGGAHCGTALLMLGKRQVCEDLSVDGFARAHQLSPAETQVLKALCRGERPTAIALRHGVALSTVRTQVGSIRAKTGTESIGALVRRVAVLPPMVGALRGGSGAAGPVVLAA
jgi:DNA-binding CsgD family transcriptional regulator